MKSIDSLLISFGAGLMLSGFPSIGTEGPESVSGTSAVSPPGNHGAANYACPTYRDSGYQVLYTAKIFSRAKVGPDGDVTPVEVRALRCMAQERDAVTWLTDLAHNGTMPGQLYALVGLRALDQEEFYRLIPQYTANEDQIRTHGGDIVISHPIAIVAAGIERGEYVHELLPALSQQVPDVESQVEWVRPDSK